MEFNRNNDDTTMSMDVNSKMFGWIYWIIYFYLGKIKSKYFVINFYSINHL